MEGIDDFKVSDIKVKPSSKLYDGDQSAPTYKTHSAKRGAVLMINNVVYWDTPATREYRKRARYDDNPSAETDSTMLEELFLQIGLEVESHINLTSEEMKEAITTFKTSSKVEGVDMVFIIIMGHGFEQWCSGNRLYTAAVIGVDGVAGVTLTTTEWVEEQFSNEQCEVLKGVPKVIIYQTCCGREVEAEGRIRKNTSDLLISYSTMAAPLSKCNWRYGSLYIKFLCKTIMENAHCIEFAALLRMTNDTMTRRVVDRHIFSAAYINLGFKNCYLHPKIYVEDDGKIKSIHGFPNTPKASPSTSPSKASTSTSPSKASTSTSPSKASTSTSPSKASTSN